jgi:Protein of unknown function (DUF2490)
MKKNFKYILLVFGFISFTNIAFAQNSKVGDWLMYFGNQKINSKFNWHNEVQYRNYNFIGDENQLLFRTGIGYNLSENNNNLLLGYGFIETKTYTASGLKEDKIVKNEHRIYQQFITKQNFNNFYIQHRYRIEERFLADDFKIRFRYFLGVNKPITKKTMEKNAMYFSAYNEIFLNDEKPIFDRNRLYGAIGYCINKNIKIETGFMVQMLENSRTSQFQIVVFNNTPFTNKN